MVDFPMVLRIIKEESAGNNRYRSGYK